MLTLILLRHAKSAWDDAGLGDHDRPLNARGRAAAPAMGRWLAASKLVPELVLCSSAVRTRETCAAVAPCFAREIVTKDVTALYLATVPTLLKIIRSIPAGPRTVLLIGHNPGIEACASLLAGEGAKPLRKAMAEKFPTAGCAVLTFEVDTWARVAAGEGRLTHWMTPRTLPPAERIKT